MKTRQIHGLGLGEFLIFAPAKEMLKSAYFFSALHQWQEFFWVCVCRFLPMLDRDWPMLRYLPLNAFFTVKAVTATSTE